MEKAHDDKLQHDEKTLSELVETELKLFKMESDNDAIRALGARALKEIEKNVFESMTNRELTSNASGTLFTPRWKLKTASK
ncbi:hypothetical protein Pcaca05_20500 [Pectobacterium carotovorum subsp. carotovorum]|nr:hypothetical protein Pcaca05_20500 [Pectobacterium carotovorum subsp. carotovorum]